MADFESQKDLVRRVKQGVNETLGTLERHAVLFKEFLRNIAQCSNPGDDDRLRQELENILPLLTDLRNVATEMENLTLSAEVKLLKQLRPKEEGSTGRQRKPVHNDLSQDSAIFSADSTVLLRESGGVHPSDQNSISSSGFVGEPVTLQLRSDLKKVATEMENLTLSAEVKLLVQLRSKKEGSAGRQRKPEQNDLSQDSGMFSADSKVLLRESGGVHPSDQNSISSSGFAGEPVENQLNSSGSDDDCNINHV